MEMLEVITRKHEDMLSFKPSDFNAVASNSFVYMEYQVIATKMKARDSYLESHILLGWSVLAMDFWLDLVVDCGCSWL